MNATKTSSPGRGLLLRWILATVALGAAFFTCSCGGDSTQPGATATYPTGISEDVEQQLKYDARVESFEAGDNDSLVVNVNDSWLNSPPGMQERSLGQWYTMWHANHSGGVIVQHDGNKVASWTSQHGYKPEPKQSSDQSHSES